MYEFLEAIKENAEVSKRELTLGVLCGVLFGLVIGMIIGSRRPQPIKPSKRIYIQAPSEKNEQIVLSPEDYD